MKIHCPKCHTCYSVEIGLIPVDGKKFRCSRCGEVWFCTHKDFLVPDSPEIRETPGAEILNSAPQNVIANEQNEILATPAPDEETVTDDAETLNKDEMNIIFKRLQEETSKINTEVQQLPTFKRLLPSIKKYLGWNNRLMIFIELLTILIIINLSIFAKRYELVRNIPQMESLFNDLGVPSKVIGEGLEFQNITRHYEDNDNDNLLNIKGFILNRTDKPLDIPVIAVNILDDNAEPISQLKKEIERKTVAAGDKVPFTLLVNIPPEQAKYILLTFSE